MAGRHKRTGRGGFSLLELVIVIAIIMIVSAMAIPIMNTSLKVYRLRASASSLKWLLQQARMQSVKDNAQYSVTSVSEGSSTRVFVDLNNNGSWDSTEPAVDIPASTAFMTTTNSPTVTSMSLTGSGSYSNSVPISVTFNSRGLPCSGSNCNSTQGYFAFLRDYKQNYGFAAVSVTPAGRMRSWYWSGTNGTTGTWY